MNTMKRLFITLIFILSLIVACVPRTTLTPPAPPTVIETKPPPELPSVVATVPPVGPPNEFNTATVMRPGVNMGNALESPNEGDEGVIIQEKYFDIIKEAGFKSVRIPIRWNAHAADVSPYTIDTVFFARVDEVVEWALARDLIVIINIHHYLTMMSDPNGQRERFLALWMQIAEHYKDYPPSLIFELLSEPSDQLIAPLWNEISNEALGEVRKSNPVRDVVYRPGVLE